MSNTAPLSMEPASSGLSELQRVVNVFVAPTKTFEDVKRKSSWWLPWLLISIAASAFFFTVDKKIGFDTIVKNNMSRAPEFVQKAIEQLPPDQRAAAMRRQITSQRIFTLYFSWVFNLIFGLIIAALLMVVFNFGMEAGIPFQKALAVIFYGWLPKIVYCLLAIVVLLKGIDPDDFNLENPIVTNLALFVDASSSRFLQHLLAGIDIFAIWEVVLIGIGFAAVAARKISTGTAITTVAFMYGIYLLIRSAL